MSNDTTKARMTAHEKMDGMSPRARHEEKRLNVLEWTYRWGWTTAMVITDLLEVERRGFAKQLVGKGFLKPITVHKSSGVYGVPIEVFALTQLGVNEVETMCSLSYLEAYRQSYYENQLTHDLVVQKIVLSLLKAGFEGYMTPQEITVHLDGRLGVKRPDAIIFSKGVKTAIELELSKKVGREWDTTRFLIAKSLREKMFDEFLIVSNSEAILRRYESELKEGRRVNLWTRNAARQWNATGTTLLTGIEGKMTTKKIKL